jgi:hypothetical protein
MRLLQCIAVLGILAIAPMTTTVDAQMIDSTSAQSLSAAGSGGDSWTWTDFGTQAIGWAAAGAAGGALSCALVGTPLGAAGSAVVGAASGAASGAAYYVATWVWNCVVGDDLSLQSAPMTALD